MVELYLAVMVFCDPMAGVQEVPWEEVVRYGVVEFKDGTAINEMKDVVEKPPLEEAKSNLAMFGRFLLSPDVIQVLSEIPLGQSNELWLTDSVREYIRRGGRVVAQPVTDGEWVTIGDPVNYLKTVLKYALTDSHMRPALEPTISRGPYRSKATPSNCSPHSLSNPM